MEQTKQTEKKIREKTHETHTNTKTYTEDQYRILGTIIYISQRFVILKDWVPKYIQGKDL